MHLRINSRYVLPHITHSFFCNNHDCDGREEEDHIGEIMVQCETCGSWQHSICMGYHAYNQIPDGDYHCEQCRPDLHRDLIKCVCPFLPISKADLIDPLLAAENPLNARVMLLPPHITPQLPPLPGHLPVLEYLVHIPHRIPPNLPKGETR